MRRGRPPYPDVLTPRQQQILELLRQGRTNEEIAEVLGISRDGAKYHVSEILSRLGVSTRQEAAAWRPEDVAITRERRWGVAALLPFLRQRGVAGGIKAAALATIGAALAAVAVLALGLLVMEHRTDARNPEAAALVATSTPIHFQEHRPPPLPTRAPMGRPDERTAMTVDEARVHLSQNSSLEAVLVAAESADIERLLELAVSGGDNYCAFPRGLPAECDSPDQKLETVMLNQVLLSRIPISTISEGLDQLFAKGGKPALALATRDSRTPAGDGGEYYLVFKTPDAATFDGTWGGTWDALRMKVVPGTDKPIQWFAFGSRDFNELQWLQFMGDENGAGHHILITPPTLEHMEGRTR